MTTKWMKQTTAAAVVALAAVSAACGEFVRDQGRSPSQVVITRLAAGEDDEATLRSDVIRLITTSPCSETSPCPTVFNDSATVQMQLMLKDPGVPGVPAAPSQLNFVTFSRYRVSYRRTDGRNTPGVDVPYPFDSAVTFTVTDAGGSSDFQIVRHSAKEEAPLRALAGSNAIISTIAEITFYGRDQAGNEVIATGSMGVDFGNFADPS